MSWPEALVYVALITAGAFWLRELIRAI